MKHLVLWQSVSFVLPNRLQIQVTASFGTANAPSLARIPLAKTEGAATWNVKAASPQRIVAVLLRVGCSLESRDIVRFNSCLLCVRAVRNCLKT